MKASLVTDNGGLLLLYIFHCATAQQRKDILPGIWASYIVGRVHLQIAAYDNSLLQLSYQWQTPLVAAVS